MYEHVTKILAFFVKYSDVVISTSTSVIARFFGDETEEIGLKLASESS